MTLTIHTLTAEDHAAVEALYTLSVKTNPEGFIQDLSFHGSIVEMATTFIQNGGDMRVAKAADGTLVGMGALRLQRLKGRIQEVNRAIRSTGDKETKSRLLAELNQLAAQLQPGPIATKTR